MLKLVLLLTAATWLQASAKGYGQTITLSLKNAPLEKVFRAIEEQSSFHFIYTKEELAVAKRVSIVMNNALLADVLEYCFKDQPLSYSIKGPYIIVKAKRAISLTVSNVIDNSISGRVINEEGDAIVGATVSIKGTNIATATNENGEWRIENADGNKSIVASSIGYESGEVAIGKGSQSIVLKRIINNLYETVVIAYGKTIRRMNTGNVSKVTAAEIARQPISNPIAALQGRVPGMVITQTSGVTGSSFNIEIRGRTSLDLSLSKNDPLFIIDGVPFEPGNLPSNQLMSAVNNPRQVSEGGISPFNTINPADIESVEILKDADATAIYGSRGANGVILITTKKGKVGKARVNIRFYSGISRVTRTMNLLNTSQYVAMRKEAFSNDGIVPTVANAPDIMLWDTTRYTDLKKLLISGTAYSQDLQAGVSGGNDQHQFYIGGGYHSETNVFSRDLTDKRSSLRFSTVHNSSNKKFHLTLTGGYSSDKNRLIQNDLTGFLNLPPNIQLQDSTGNISWSEKGVNFPGVNPLAVFLKKYVSVNDNLQGSLQSSFQFTKQFSVRINTGYMVFGSEESLIEPKASIAPNQSGVASAQFANMQTKNWIAEPQFQYITTLGKAKINMLVGATWQEKISSGKTITASNYTNDLLLYSIEAAGSVVVSNSYSQYRYAAFFGRMNYEYDGKYIVNLSGRRDGSSRFAGERRFANFGAGGIAWIFSGESWIKKGLPFLSFGKLRGSYGVTGNDQIGDYKYLNLWGSSSLTYQGAPGLRPTSLYNPNYNWERNRKFELAIELGFLKDRIQFSAAYYRNRSNNQLINYRLPLQTGFGNVTRNFDALVQNSGLEVAFISKNVLTNSFSWTTNINLTIPRNKLVSFPGLASSSYSGMYLIGQSLSVIYKYRFQGLDTATGLYLYEDLNRDGSINSEDRQSLGHTDCKYYGGIQNELTYKAISFSFFIEGKKHTGRNYLYQHRGSYPGSANNQPILVLNRWQNPGDPGPIQKLTTISSSLAGGTGAIRLFASNGVYGDASFLRLKNISFSYSIPKNLLQRIHMESIQLYINAQNLITLTKYQGSDPETQNYYQLPPLKTIVFGFNLNF